MLVYILIPVTHQLHMSCNSSRILDFFIQGSIRINQKNYEEAYVNDPVSFGFSVFLCCFIWIAVNHLQLQCMLWYIHLWVTFFGANFHYDKI